MKGLIFTVSSGIFIWMIATLFFIIFGDRILVSPESDNYGITTFLLVACTGLLLWGATSIYILVDKTEYAPLKFGIVGTIIGLSLDTFSISFHHVIFPNFTESQVIAFTAWMTFAYALFLFIPAMVGRQRMKLNKTAIVLKKGE